MNKKHDVSDFQDTSVFVLAFSMAAFTVLVLIKTLVAVFETSVIDQFRSIYYLTDYSSSTVSLVSGIFGAIVTLLLGTATFGLFFVIFSASRENLSKVIAGMNLIKFSAVFGLIVSIITVVCSVASVSVVNYYTITVIQLVFIGTVTNSPPKIYRFVCACKNKHYY